MNGCDSFVLARTTNEIDHGVERWELGFVQMEFCRTQLDRLGEAGLCQTQVAGQQNTLRQRSPGILGRKVNGSIDIVAGRHVGQSRDSDLRQQCSGSFERWRLAFQYALEPCVLVEETACVPCLDTFESRWRGVCRKNFFETRRVEKRHSSPSAVYAYGTVIDDAIKGCGIQHSCDALVITDASQPTFASDA